MALPAISAAMTLWNEASTVRLAMESVRNLVSEFVIFDRSTDGTANIALELLTSWQKPGLIRRHNLPNLSAARYATFQQCSGDWILVLDGDWIYHTDGPDALTTALVDLDDNSPDVWLCPVGYLLGLPGDSPQRLPEFTYDEKPWCVPHPFLYRKRADLAPTRVAGDDLPCLRSPCPVHMLPRPVVFDYVYKPVLRQFLRIFLLRWQQAADFETWPTLESFAAHVLQLPAVDLPAAAETWWHDRRAALLPWDEAANGYLPALIRGTSVVVAPAPVT